MLCLLFALVARDLRAESDAYVFFNLFPLSSFLLLFKKIFVAFYKKTRCKYIELRHIFILFYVHG